MALLDNKKNLSILVIVLLIAAAAVYFYMNQSATDADSTSETSTTQQETSSDGDSEAAEKKQSNEEETPENKKEPGDVGARNPPIKDKTIKSGTRVTSQVEAQKTIEEALKDESLGDAKVTVNGQESDEYGNTYYYAEQTYKGIPVYATRAVLQVKNDEAGELSGSWFPDIDLDIVPKNDVDTALRNAMNERGMPESRGYSKTDEGKLIVFATNEGYKLVWLLKAYFTNPESQPYQFFIDAKEEVILVQQEIFEQ